MTGVRQNKLLILHTHTHIYIYDILYYIDIQLSKHTLGR